MSQADEQAILINSLRAELFFTRAKQKRLRGHARRMTRSLERYRAQIQEALDAMDAGDSDTARRLLEGALLHMSPSDIDEPA